MQNIRNLQQIIVPQLQLTTAVNPTIVIFFKFAKMQQRRFYFINKLVLNHLEGLKKDN